MSTRTETTAHTQRCTLLAIAGLLALALGLHGPIAQWPGYHLFADTRGWLGLPNAENVLSNLPFALIGAWGLWVHVRDPNPRSMRPGRPAWAVFSAAIVATAFGSALYHWAPGNEALVADRLPIAWACAVLLCGFLAERVDRRWAGGPALAAAVAIATVTVLAWWLGERQGRGDLRPYLFVQFLPMLLVPAALWLKLPVFGMRAVPDRTWWAVLGLYGMAKLCELADHALLEMLGIVSGHTLKHLFAAGAAWCLLQATCPRARPRPHLSRQLR